MLLPRSLSRLAAITSLASLLLCQLVGCADPEDAPTAPGEPALASGAPVGAGGASPGGSTGLPGSAGHSGHGTTGFPEETGSLDNQSPIDDAPVAPGQRARGEHAGGEAAAGAGGEPAAGAGGEPALACAPGSTLGCSGGLSISVCAGDGRGATAVPCPDDAPLCIEGACTPCVSDEQCPQPVAPCKAASCYAGRCGSRPLPSGTPLPSQVPHDCRQIVCDYKGEPGYLADPDDPPADDGDPCTVERCDGLLAVTGLPAPAGAPCEGGVCDGMGTCEP
jgi:hypothetical protein